jgi:hypothetical protein
VPGTQIQGGNTPVWASSIGNGVYYVALFNLGSSSGSVTVNWSSLGFTGLADIRDLWSNSDLGTANGSYSASLNSHASQLIKVTVMSSGLITPAISLTALPTTGVVGSSVTISAAVSSPSGTPSGTVNFYSGSISLGSASLNTGVASLMTTALPASPDSVTAAYQGDSIFGPVTSSPLIVTVNPAFGITATPTSLGLSATSRQAASVLTVTPGGSSNTLSFACANLPASIGCSFSPSTLALAGVSTPQTVTMTVSDPTLSAGLTKSSGKKLPDAAFCGLEQFPKRCRLVMARLCGDDHDGDSLWG